MKEANLLRNSLNKNLKNNLNSSANDSKSVGISNNFSDSPEKNVLSVGVDVLVKPFNMVGTILTMPNKSNEVMVQFGNTKTNVKVENLELVKKSDKLNNLNNNIKSNSTNHSRIGLKSKSVSPEINVIGLTVEDAIFAIDKYLDDCYLANLPNARIVHGKGTGKLREGIHAFLRKHPHVKSFRLGTFGEGEMGVTVVEFK